MMSSIFEELLFAFVKNLVPYSVDPGEGTTKTQRLKSIGPAALARIERDSQPPFDMVKGRDGVWRVAREKKP